jgi:uncharacterized membrane protein
MKAYVVSYAAALVVFLAADMVWLGTMVGRIYRPALGDILAPTVNLPPALFFYLIYPVGFFTYATYDLSNFATLRNWTFQVTVIDIVWGTLLGAMTAAVASYVAIKIAGTT